MTKQNLKQLIQSDAFRLDSIQDATGMPYHTLQGIRRGDREVPDKWVPALTRYFKQLGIKT